jgi:hypothetical protein
MKFVLVGYNQDFSWAKDYTDDLVIYDRSETDEFIKDLKYPEKRVYHLNIGDIVERKLIDGDILLLNPKYLF